MTIVGTIVIVYTGIVRSTVCVSIALFGYETPPTRAVVFCIGVETGTEAFWIEAVFVVVVSIKGASFLSFCSMETPSFRVGVAFVVGWFREVACTMAVVIVVIVSALTVIVVGCGSSSSRRRLPP